VKLPGANLPINGEPFPSVVVEHLDAKSPTASISGDKKWQDRRSLALAYVEPATANLMRFHAAEIQSA
jgi:hypothetical protein